MTEIVDYQKMYYILCRAASDALDVMPETDDTRDAWQILQTALYETEEIYISLSDQDGEKKSKQ